MDVYIEEVRMERGEVKEQVEEMKDPLMWPRIQVQKHMKWRDSLYNIYFQVDDEQYLNIHDRNWVK